MKAHISPLYEVGKRLPQGKMPEGLGEKEVVRELWVEPAV